MLEQAGLVGHGVRSALNMHRTRHTFATEMRRVARVEAASQALSHSDLSTTLGIYGHQHYGHQDQRDLERAMELFARTREAKRPQAGGTIRRRSSTEPLDLQEKWRRRESNPRPRTHREERLQACPAIRLRPPAGSQAAYRRTSHPSLSRLGRLALPRQRARSLTPLPDPRAETGATRCLGARQRVRLRDPHLLCFPVVLRGRPGTSACSSSGDRPRRNQIAPVCLPHCSRLPRARPSARREEGKSEPEHHSRRRPLSARSICRFASRSAIARRLSCASFPRASAISTFTRPSLK